MATGRSYWGPPSDEPTPSSISVALGHRQQDCHSLFLTRETKAEEGPLTPKTWATGGRGVR